MHGAIYLAMKLKTVLYTGLQYLQKVLIVFLLLLLELHQCIHCFTFRTRAIQLNRILRTLFFLLSCFSAIANIPRQLKRKIPLCIYKLGGYYCSTAITVAIEVFPNPGMQIILQQTALLYKTQHHLKTMKILLIIALIGTPLVGVYTSFVFWTFKGKVQLDEMSYWTGCFIIFNYFIATHFIRYMLLPSHLDKHSTLFVARKYTMHKPSRRSRSTSAKEYTTLLSRLQNKGRCVLIHNNGSRWLALQNP